MCLCRDLTWREGGGEEVQESRRVVSIPMRQPTVLFACSPPTFRHQVCGSPRQSWCRALPEDVMCPRLRICSSLGSWDRVTCCSQTSSRGPSAGPAHLKGYLCSLTFCSLLGMVRPVVSVIDLGMTAWISQGCVRRFRGRPCASVGFLIVMFLFFLFTLLCQRAHLSPTGR